MDYIPDMDDDSEGDRQHNATTSKKEDMMKLRSQHSMESMSNKSILETDVPQKLLAKEQVMNLVVDVA
ncbi:hypothetical protein R6Q57_011523 [Mikania cordata]